MPKISFEQFNQHSWAWDQEVPKMSLRIGHRKCSNWISEASKRIHSNHARLDKAREMSTNSFGRYKINFFGPRMAREMLKISFGCRFWKASKRKQRKSRHGTVPPAVWKTRENVWFSQHFRKKQRRTRCALDGTETQKTRENALFSMSFWGADVPRKLPKVIWTRTLARDTPNLRFGSLKTHTRFAAESQKTRENAWFSQHLEKSDEKRIKTSMKNEAATTRSEKREKRVKTRGFWQVSEETSRENDEKASPEPPTRAFKNAWKRVVLAIFSKKR